MAVDRRIGTKVDRSLRREDAPGTRVDPYPYIGIVKNNLDPTRSGRLQVYIPDLGGDPTDKKNWRTVRYASPFTGYTNTTERSSTNSFETVQHSYGMWFVPPDLGVQVICMFIAGDPTRGYWLACVNPYLSHHMIPALGGSQQVDVSNASEETKKGIVKGNRMPVVEFNLSQDALIRPEFYNNPKPIHSYQFDILKTQGLDRDSVRGSISSSSQRETPSHVFGISTPGRPIPDPADNPQDYIKRVEDASITSVDLPIKSRKGGHTFVMDDGATLGQDQLIRLRTAAGHQILMHDTANCLYISHADGSSWLEMTKDGSILVYTKGSFSVHSEGSMNFRSGNNINFEAQNNIRWRAINGKAVLNCGGDYELLCGKLKIETLGGPLELKSAGILAIDAGGKVSVQSGGTVNIQGAAVYQNTGGTVAVKPLTPLKTTNFNSTEFKDSTWQIKPGAVSSIVSILPTHEPYARDEQLATFEVQGTGIQPQEKYTGAVDAIKNVTGSGVKSPAGDKDIRDQPETNQSIGPLNKEQLQAYYAQIGKSESGGKYDTVNSIGFVGKYQFGYQALIDGGYVKSSVTSNAQLNNPNSWTTKDGITSKEAWLANGPVQEAAMEAYTASNYRTMVRIGAVTKDMPPEEVGGMLATAHLLGAGGAKKWRNGAGGSDAFGTTGDSYFQKGKFAVAVLGPKVSGLNAG